MMVAVRRLPPDSDGESLAASTSQIFGDGVHMRSRLVSVFVVISLAAVLACLNARETQTVTEPHYVPMLGAIPHPPPYKMKEMTISIHSDRGWPIWHTRSSGHFAAHNAATFANDNGLSYEKPTQRTEPVRAVVDLVAGALVLAVAFYLCEMIARFASPPEPSEIVASYEHQA